MSEFEQILVKINEEYVFKITPNVNIGDIVIFRNSYCIHKATKPKVTKRDVININIYPSIKKFSLDFYKDNLNKTFFNSGYSLNPFNNSPQENLIEKKI